MVDELAEVGVSRRDRRVVVTARLVEVLHRRGEVLQARHGVGRLGQQVARVDLQGRKQEVEVLQVHRGHGRGGEAHLGSARCQTLPGLLNHVYGCDLPVR